MSVDVPEELLEYLVDCASILECLMDGGVEEWEGYEEAMEPYFYERSEEEKKGMH